MQATKTVITLQKDRVRAECKRRGLPEVKDIIQGAGIDMSTWARSTRPGANPSPILLRFLVTNGVDLRKVWV